MRRGRPCPREREGPARRLPVKAGNDDAGGMSEANRSDA